MNANTAIRRDTLQFDANVPYELVLKYATGRQVSNGRIMFSTTTDEVFFLDPDDGRKIHDLGLAPNEPFEIMRRVIGAGRNSQTTFVVGRVEKSQQPVVRPAAAATTEPILRSGQSSQGNGSSLRQILASAYISAIGQQTVATGEGRGFSAITTANGALARKHLDGVSPFYGARAR